MNIRAITSTLAVLALALTVTVSAPAEAHQVQAKLTASKPTINTTGNRIEAIATINVPDPQGFKGHIDRKRLGVSIEYKASRFGKVQRLTDVRFERWNRARQTSIATVGYCRDRGWVWVRAVARLQMMSHWWIPRSNSHSDAAGFLEVPKRSAWVKVRCVR